MTPRPPRAGCLRQTWEPTFIKMMVTLRLAEKALEKAQRASGTPEGGSSEGDGFPSVGSKRSEVTAVETRSHEEILQV